MWSAIQRQREPPLVPAGGRTLHVGQMHRTPGYLPALTVLKYLSEPVGKDP